MPEELSPDIPDLRILDDQEQTCQLNAYAAHYAQQTIRNYLRKYHLPYALALIERDFPGVIAEVMQQ